MIMIMIMNKMPAVFYVAKMTKFSNFVKKTNLGSKLSTDIVTKSEPTNV